MHEIQNLRSEIQVPERRGFCTRLAALVVAAGVYVPAAVAGIFAP